MNECTPFPFSSAFSPPTPAPIDPGTGTRTREAETLRAGLERAQGILTKAQRLVSQLGGEQERWQDQAMSLSDALSTLPLKMLLAAGFATYLVRLVGISKGGAVRVQRDGISVSFCRPMFRSS